MVVALIAAQGEINFDPSLLSVDRILDEIASLGYKASLLDSNYNRDNHIQFLVRLLFNSNSITLAFINLLYFPRIFKLRNSIARDSSFE